MFGQSHESEQFKTCRKHVCSSTIPGFEAADVMEFAMSLRTSLKAEGVLSLMGIVPEMYQRNWANAMLYDFLDPSWDQVMYNAGQALQYIPRKSKRAWMLSFDDTVDPPQYELDGKVIIGGAIPNCRTPLGDVLDGTAKLDPNHLAQLSVSFIVKPIDTRRQAFDIGMFPHRYTDLKTPAVTRRCGMMLLCAARANNNEPGLITAYDRHGSQVLIDDAFLGKCKPGSLEDYPFFRELRHVAAHQLSSTWRFRSVRLQGSTLARACRVWWAGRCAWSEGRRAECQGWRSSPA